MKAMVLHEWGAPLVLQELPVPGPGPKEVLLRVRACGVGDTLNNMRSGRNASMPGAALPRIIGHEVVGEIVELGAEVRELAQGDRVFVYMYLTCGRCEECRWGHDPLCRNLQGMMGLSRDGGFAEYMVAPVENVERIPDGVSNLDGCVAVDAIATPWHALRTVAKLGPTDTLVVIGAGGGVGVHAVMIGSLLRARVIGVDITDEKLNFAQSHGADNVVDGRIDVVEAVLELTGGRGADVVVDYVATAKTLDSAFSCLAPNGRLVIQGVNPIGDEFRVEPRRFIHAQRSVSGSRYASRREVLESMLLVDRGLVRPAVTRTAELGLVEDLFEAIAGRELLGRAAVTFGD